MYFIQINDEMKAGRLSLAWPVRGTAIHAGSKKMPCAARTPFIARANIYKCYTIA